MYNTKNLVENLGTYESMKTVSSTRGGGGGGGGGPDAINCIQYRWDVHSEAQACQDWRNLFVSMHAFDTLVLYNCCVHV